MPKIIKVIAYKATNGKLFEDEDEALQHSFKLWEEKLAAFMGKLKLDEDFNPIKNHIKLMEFMLAHRWDLQKLFNESDFETEGGAQ